MEVWIQRGIGTEIELNISETSAYAEHAPVSFCRDSGGVKAMNTIAMLDYRT
jgi:hypothetical protein